MQTQLVFLPFLKVLKNSNEPRVFNFFARWMFKICKKHVFEKMDAAEAPVKANLSKVPATPLKGLGEYRDYVLQVDTTPVRGICCALFERALSHAMKSPDPKQVGSMVAAIEFGAAGHAGNNCPKDLLVQGSCCPGFSPYASAQNS